MESFGYMDYNIICLKSKNKLVLQEKDLQSRSYENFSFKTQVGQLKNLFSKFSFFGSIFFVIHP